MVSVLEDCINWYYLNSTDHQQTRRNVLEDCINWYYLNHIVFLETPKAVLEDCINWYYLNKKQRPNTLTMFLRIVLIGII